MDILDSKLGMIRSVLVFASPKKQLCFLLLSTAGSVSKDTAQVPLAFVQISLNLKPPVHPTDEAGVVCRLSQSGMATLGIYTPPAQHGLVGG